MIEKQEFYHGAAILRVIQDGRCATVRIHDGGYMMNDDRFILLKYSTRANSPWRFTLSQDELAMITQLVDSGARVFFGFVCGGDGICGVSWENIRSIIETTPAWISCTRRFNGRYAVAGALGKLNRKVPLNQWPEVLFGVEQDVVF